MKQLFKIFIACAAGLSLASCKENPDFAKGSPAPHIAIETLRNLYKGNAVNLDQKALNGATRITGVVISDATAANIPAGTVIIQNTARGTTRGLVIPLGAVTVPVAMGDSVSIVVAGKTLAKVNGSMQVEGVNAGDIKVISSNNVVPSRQISFPTLLANPELYESTLVQAVNVNVSISPETGQTYNGDKVLTDGAESSMTLHTEADATFAATKVPAYGIFTGIARLNNTDLQIWIRNLNDVVAVPEYIMSLYSGMGTAGYVDGAPDLARYRSPEGVEFDNFGNLYVADRGNHRIRKIAPGGLVTTLAGSGVAGAADGLGLLATFNGPWDLGTDAAGNVYVADLNNQKIRKVTPAGLVSTYAGSGIAGLVNGAADIAQFNAPLAVAVDRTTGNVIAGENLNHLLRRITPEGVVSTFAGNGSGYSDGIWYEAQFKQPSGVAVDKNGNVYVADRANNRIRKITPAGVVTTVAGTGTAGANDGDASSARFNGPYGIAVDAKGNIFVADLNNHKVRCILTTGTVITVVGNGIAGKTLGAGNLAQLSSPTDIAIDADGNIYVADLSNNRITKIVPVVD